jgi:hypothetical protein
MAATALPPGIGVRRWERRDGTVTESYTVRWREPDGTKRRRSFDTLDDALDFHAKRRSARRWRPEELRLEQAGRLTLALGHADAASGPIIGGALFEDDCPHDDPPKLTGLALSYGGRLS